MNVRRALPRATTWIALSGVVLTLLSAACSSDSGGGSDRVRVVTTVSPITNLVQNVGGDRIEVVGIVPEGTNSHTFEPAPSDARVMAEADVVFVNGLHLEEPTRELAEANVRARRTSTSTTSASLGRKETPIRTCGPTRRMPNGTPSSSGTR